MNRFLLLPLLVLTIGCHAQSKTKPAAKDKAECTDQGGLVSRVYGGDRQWKCVSGKWTEDTEAEARIQKHREERQEEENKLQKHLQTLWNALRTRVVAEDELDEIMKLGPNVIPDAEGGGSIDWCGGASSCYLPQDYKQQEENRRAANEKIFSDALYNQFRMRLLKEKEDSKPCDKDCGQ